MLDNLIFYVDDDSEDLASFLYVAKMMEIEVRLFNSSDHVLDQLKQAADKPMSIFVDLNMPGINGFEVIRQIAQDDTLNSIPVFAFSTANDPHSIQLAKDAGATCYIPKPNTIAQLKKTLYFVVSTDWPSYDNTSNFLVML